jgi:hypothetical protein
METIGEMTALEQRVRVLFLGYKREAIKRRLEEKKPTGTTYPRSREREGLVGKDVHPPLLKMATSERLGKRSYLVGGDLSGLSVLSRRFVLPASRVGL